MLIQRQHHFISLGAGVQSSTLALMFAHGMFDVVPDGAIFADTQGEPASVYAWLETLKGLIAAAPHPFPVYTVTAGSLAGDTLKLRTSRKTGQKYVRALIPAFFEMPNSKHGRGLLGRKCTAEYKVRALKKKQRQLAKVPRARKGVTRPVSVITYLGISWDEVERMKASQDDWNECRWPLIDLKMTRQDCKSWMHVMGYPEPPRSACTFCPSHSDQEWARLKFREPEEFAKAVDFDVRLRNLAEQSTGTAKLAGPVYLHSSLKPLSEVEFKDDDPKDQFGNECEGLCGV